MKKEQKIKEILDEYAIKVRNSMNNKRYKERKVKCPKCGKEGLPETWMGYYPPKCSECGHQAKDIKIEC